VIVSVSWPLMELFPMVNEIDIWIPLDISEHVELQPELVQVTPASLIMAPIMMVAGFWFAARVVV
jgi:hypothetical protein